MLIALLTLAFVQNSAVSDKQAVVLQEDLVEALGIYRVYDLPLPPSNARMIAFPDGESYPDGVVRYGLGFETSGVGAENPTHLIGLAVLPTRVRGYRTRYVEQASYVSEDEIRRLRTSSIPPFTEFGAEARLAFALQMAHLGRWETAARIAALIEPSQKQLHAKSLAARTHDLVADHWTVQYFDGFIDSGTPLRHLRRVYKHLTRGGEERRLVGGILLANPESPSMHHEDLIDQLVHYEKDASLEGLINPISLTNQLTSAIFARGKAIIPSLIAHMNDNRVTAETGGLYNFGKGDGRLTIGDICTYIVGSLTNSERINNGWTADEEACVWWMGAHEMPEEELLKRVIFLHPEDSRQDLTDVFDLRLNAIPLQMYALRFPSKLDDLYLESFDWKHNTNSALAEMIAKSDLPEKRKIELFMSAEVLGTRVHQDVAAEHLKGIQPDAPLKALLRHLESDDPFGSRGRSDGLAQNLAWRAIDLGDHRAVQLLVSKAKLHSADIRVSVLEGAFLRQRHSKQKERSIGVLRQFLRDSEEYPTATKNLDLDQIIEDRRHRPFDLLSWRNPIKVKDFAAWRIGRLLDISLKPQSSWNDEEWASYHTHVTRQLEKHASG